MTEITTTYVDVNQSIKEMYIIKGIHNCSKEEIKVWLNLYDEYLYTNVEITNDEGQIALIHRYLNLIMN